MYMLKQQKGLCKICDHPLMINKWAATDHNHKTGRVRGLLCSVCNGNIGWFERNRERVFAHLSEPQ